VAEFSMIEATVSGSSEKRLLGLPFPKRWMISAASPATCGEAIEVPCRST
jgi:hypothetical protein